ncbi:MAG TPA: hypothetical protein PLP27_00375 [Crocinitomicaceae bacterium]|nr:hypothetical protein [Crocinitomicaceae bacterium]
MRYLSFFAISFFSIAVFAQKSEMLIPRDAATVFSINNVNLLKKISMDDLVQYEFMEEVQSELFNGSTNNKTIKDAGFDFDQRINAFFGETHEYQISGFTFGVSKATEILKVFDNFDEITSHIPDVKIYRNDINYLFIQGSSALIIRVEPSVKLVTSIADSIWIEGGYGFYIPGEYDGLYNYETYEDDYEAADVVEEIDTTFSDDLELTSAEESLDDINKNYWELRDSISFEYGQLFIRKISTELFIDKISLHTDYEDYRNQLSKTVDAVFYLDNSRNLTNSKGIWQFQNIFPSLFSDAQILYENNVITGELNIVKNEIVVDIYSKYNRELGKIYSNIAKTPFNSSFQKYIHKDALAYFTYNINLKKAYQTSFDVIMKIIEKENNEKIISNVLLAELINEFVDIDNIFSVYQGSMFGSLNGYKKIKVSHIDYQYDEETFEYSETETEEDQDVPNITIGLKSEKPEFIARVARLMSKVQPDIIKHDNYYEVKNAFLNTVPVYFAVVKDVLIISVDENLFTTHIDGYAKSEQIKISKAKKSKFTYINVNLDQTIKKLPRELLSEKQNEIIGTLIDKTGNIEFKTKKISPKDARFQLTYTLNEDIENNGKYLLDLVNSLYTLTK